MHDPGARRTLALASLLLPLALPAPGLAQSDGPIVVVDLAVAGDDVHLTVATHGAALHLESAGLFVNGTLVSNATGGLWLSPGVRGGLALRLHAAHAKVDLRMAYERSGSANGTAAVQTIPLALPDRADVRPVDARLDAAGNVTVALRNLGRGAARDLLVALHDGDGPSVGLPYVQAIAALPPGGLAEVAFALVASPARPVVVVEHDGARRAHPVVLRAAGGSGAGAFRALEVTTEFPALEGAPGGAVAYPLRIVNRGPERLVALGTTGLPEAYGATFTTGGSRVQTVLLAAGATREVALEVRVPPAGAVPGALDFQAWVAAADAAGPGGDARLAEASLRLTASGAQRLELAGRNWFAAAAPGEALAATLEVRNRGTAAAHDVVLAADAPLGWEVRFEPARVARIGPGEAAQVTLHVAPPPGTADGRYVVDVAAETTLGAARERSFTVEVAAEPPSQLPWLLAAGAAGLAAVGLVVFLRRT